MLIIFTFLYTVCIVSAVFYFLQAPNAQWMGDKPAYLYNGIYVLVAYFLFGYIASLASSYSHCNQMNPVGSLRHGASTGVLALITIVAVSLLTFLRQPFLNIIPNEWVATVVAHCFFLFLNIVLLSIVNTHDSTIENCKISPSEMDRELEDMDAYLDEPDPEDENPAIEVKH